MGNDQSALLDDEKRVLEELYSISGGRLDRDPNVNDKVNAGTTAPDCQPSHTRQQLKDLEAQRLKEREEEERLARLVGVDDSLHPERRKGSLLDKEEEYDDDDQEWNDEGKLINDFGEGPGGARRASSSESSASAPASARRSPKQSQHKKSQPKEPEKGSIGSYVQMAKTGYQELVNAIIRPPRADYKEEHLGPPAFMFCGRRFTRVDFTLRTKRGLNLQCSHWEPVERSEDRIPVVIYMHGNASARVEVLPQLSYLLSLGLAVFAFDFAGSGKSDGDYVSLGYYEREDLMCVIAHLRATHVVSTIALWGRSMGAATALMHGDRDPSIACMILDSSFADLTQLCEEMVDKARAQGINVPGFVSSVAIRMIRGSVRKQADFDIRNISPIAHADKCFIPALFVAGERDDFIDKRHSQSIHDRYAGDKNLIVVDGDHNSPRPRFMFDSVSIFLQTCLQIPDDGQLKTHPGMNLMAPPWLYPGSPEGGGGVAAALRGVVSPTRSPTRTQNNNNQEQKAEEGKEVVHIDAAEEAAAALAAEVSEEMGMTKERQEEIQGSLFKMLGQQETREGGGSGVADDAEQSPPNDGRNEDGPATAAVGTGTAKDDESGSGGAKTESESQKEKGEEKEKDAAAPDGGKGDGRALETETSGDDENGSSS